jgi:hypothetical protein
VAAFKEWIVIEGDGLETIAAAAHKQQNPNDATAAAVTKAA